MKNLVMVMLAVCVLSGCETVHEGLTYVQSNTVFCSGGHKFIHNADGTSTAVFGNAGQPAMCQ